MKAIFGLNVPGELLRCEYEDGASVKDIGKKYGRSEQTIRNHLAIVGCEMQNMRAPTTLTHVPDEDIQHLYKAGNSLAKIATLYGCSAPTIQRRLIKMGYVIRSIGTEEHRRMMSAAKQGISYDEWESYAITNNNYCPKFDDACRESNREKYGHRCFLCGKTKDENGYNLSVHHVDMNKAQGCDGHTWKLVPLCGSCHSRAHLDIWVERIEYILKHVW